MQLTNAQKVLLKNWVIANNSSRFDESAVSALNAIAAPDFVVWRKTVNTSEVGKTVNYVAVEAMTDANRTRITTFYAMNPVSFEPRADIRTYWENTFSGALGGEGANTRSALTALWKKKATVAEKLFAVGPGAGTDGDPATLGTGADGLPAEGAVTLQQVIDSESAS